MKTNEINDESQAEYKTEKLGSDETILAKAADILFSRIKRGFVRIENCADLQEFFKFKLGARDIEVFATVTLDSQNRVINYHELVFGTVNEAKIHPRLVMEKIFEDKAASVIFCHNHPSGSVTPSRSDNTLTTEFKKHLDFFGINLIDHVIVGNNEHYSYAAMGL